MEGGKGAASRGGSKVCGGLVCNWGIICPLKGPPCGGAHTGGTSGCKSAGCTMGGKRCKSSAFPCQGKSKKCQTKGCGKWNGPNNCKCKETCSTVRIKCGGGRPPLCKRDAKGCRGDHCDCGMFCPDNNTCPGVAKYQGTCEGTCGEDE